MSSLEIWIPHLPWYIKTIQTNKKSLIKINWLNIYSKEVEKNNDKKIKSYNLQTLGTKILYIILMVYLWIYHANIFSNTLKL